MMDSRIKELLVGKQRQAGPGKFRCESSGKRSLLPCRLDCALQSDQAVVVAGRTSPSRIQCNGLRQGQKWLAFIPLTGAHYGQTSVSFDLDTLKVPAPFCLVLSGTARAKALQEIAQICGRNPKP